MKIIYNISIALIVSLLLFSCGGFKLKKKATSGEEFLIEKKDPLILPPDFSKLPQPNEQADIVNEDIDIKSVFNGENSSSEKEANMEGSSDSEIKKSILKKIQK